MSDFRAFFQRATANPDHEPRDPYPYQLKLAQTPIATRALNVPTGAGKTAAVLLSWFYRLTEGFSDAPRRLVYCLPMRTLVEQTRDDARQWIGNLGLTSAVRIATLMGGEVDDRWAGDPEQPFLLIGTQDMILSRLLNRGYAVKRYQWPMQFGLLNNDCLFVFDEVQLMGDGLATSTQLAAFRERFGTFSKCPSIWMSATMSASQLQTVDVACEPETFSLSADDYTVEALSKRLNAKKAVQQAPELCRHPAGLAQFIFDNHKPGTQTIAVVNRVTRAQEVYSQLEKLNPAAATHLLHSRFRAQERRTWRETLNSRPGPNGRILIATQVIEAGVDISSALLITDLAPWSSIVQRFGRCNRAGEVEFDARIYWIDRPLTGKNEPAEELTDQIAKPYTAIELAEAETRLRGLADAAPASLPTFNPEYRPSHVLRRRDLVDLFDTTSDLSGYDLDVSRFIRSVDDRDLSVAWRTAYPPKFRKDAPSLLELCSAPISDFKKLLAAPRKKVPFEACVWNPLGIPAGSRRAKGAWEPVFDANKLRPGMVLIANSKSGAYDVERGWEPDSIRPVPVAKRTRHAEEEGMDSNPSSFPRYTQSLQAHCREVRDAMQAILLALDKRGIDLSAFRADLLHAALHHDWGKSHPVFQETLDPEGRWGVLLAKSQKEGRHRRPFFRHELASALALLQEGASDLSVYLVASHHGKVRLSIRALPKERKPSEPDKRFARGIWEGDLLPEAILDGIEKSPVSLSLNPMLIGTGDHGVRSWTDRAVALREEIGIFRLAYLEALLIAADWRASNAPREKLS